MIQQQAVSSVFAPRVRKRATLQLPPKRLVERGLWPHVFHVRFVRVRAAGWAGEGQHVISAVSRFEPTRTVTLPLFLSRLSCGQGEDQGVTTDFQGRL